MLGLLWLRLSKLWVRCWVGCAVVDVFHKDEKLEKKE